MNFDGFVISGDAREFFGRRQPDAVAALIQEQEWDEIDLMISAFQGMTQAIKYCPRPIVAAPSAYAWEVGPRSACTRRRGRPMRSFTWALSRRESG